MKKFILLGFFLSLPALAINAPNPSPNVIGLGAIGVTTSPTSQVSGGSLTSTFTIIAGNISAALVANDFYPFFKNGVAYQVTAGKTAYCFNQIFNPTNALDDYQLVSATASFTYASAAITGGVHESGAAGRAMHLGITANQPIAIPGTYQFGASTFPGIQTPVAHSLVVQLDCTEI